MRLRHIVLLPRVAAVAATIVARREKEHGDGASDGYCAIVATPCCCRVIDCRYNIR